MGFKILLTQRNKSILFYCILILCFATYLYIFYNKCITDKNLIDAIERNDCAGVRLSLAQGANPNAVEAPGLVWQFFNWFKFKRNQQDYGTTALQIALGERRSHFQTHYPKPRTDIILALLSQGANINALGYGGETPLMFAATYLDSDVVALLVHHGADINLASHSGYTALHQVILRDDSDLTFLLITNGANVNARTRSGITPLHLAVVSCNPSIVKLLLIRGADPNTLDLTSGSPLAKMATLRSDAVSSSKFRQVVLLLKQFGGRLIFSQSMLRSETSQTLIGIQKIRKIMQ